MRRLPTNTVSRSKLAHRCERAAVVVFRMRKGRVEFLLVSRKSDPDQFVLPGGHVDYGETLAKAAKRECLEEAGAAVRILGPLVRFEHFNARGISKLTMAYLAEAESVQPSPEGRDVVWARHDDLMEGDYDVPYATLDVLDFAAQCLRQDIAA